MLALFKATMSAECGFEEKFVARGHIFDSVVQTLDQLPLFLGSLLNTCWFSAGNDGHDLTHTQTPTAILLRLSSVSQD